MKIQIQDALLIDSYFGDGSKGPGRYWYIEQRGRHALETGVYETEDGK